MGLRGRLVWVFALWLSSIGGCTQVDPHESVLVQVGETDREGEPVRVLEGVEVCEMDTSNCAVTDVRGEATLEVLPGEVSFALAKQGYEGSLRPLVIDARSGGPLRLQYPMWPDALAADWYEAAMSQYPPTGVGTVYVGLEPSIEGATFHLRDATGEAFYTEGASFHPSLDLEATTSTGAGGFFEVVPGEFEIEVGGAASHCVPGAAWPADTENTIRFPVLDGHLTSLTVTCAAP